MATTSGVSTLKLTSCYLAAMDLLQNYPVAVVNSFSAGSAAQLTDVELLEPSGGPQQGYAASCWDHTF